MTRGPRRIVLALPFMLGLACAGLAGQPEATPTTGAPTRSTAVLPTRAPATATSTASPRPSAAPTRTPSPTSTSRASGFTAFASQIADALQKRDAAFFSGKARTGKWTCLGDETTGVCKGKPSGAMLDGVLVAQNWEEYEVLGTEEYRATWQDIWDQGRPVSLQAIGHQYGDNPLMPLAEESFQAIIQVDTGRADDPDVHVLFFELDDQAWRLAGELVVTVNEGRWLQGTCTTCFDEWTAW